MHPTAPAQHLRGLASRVAAPFVDLGAHAVLLTGSAATGTSDEYSDIDLVLFYGDLPDRDDLRAAVAGLGGHEHRPIGDDPDGGFVVEQWTIDGVACQFVHQTLAAWDANSAEVLVDHDVSSVTQKALSGLQTALPLHGEDLIARLRAEAAYPEGLARAMVTANLDVFPLWRYTESLAARDAELFQRTELVAGLSKVLAVLAGANRVYFSPFQLKHMRDLIASFADAPPRLAERIEAALVAPMPHAALEMEELLADALDVVDRRVPDVNTTAVRRRLGARDTPWRLPGR